MSKPEHKPGHYQHRKEQRKNETLLTAVQALFGGSVVYRLFAHFLKDPEFEAHITRLIPKERLPLIAAGTVAAGAIGLISQRHLSASAEKQLGTTMNELEARGIGFHSLTEAIDTSTSTGKFTFNIFAALAAFERELIKDRTQEGLRAAAARGRRGGRPRALSEEQKRMALAMLKVEDITAKQIAEQLGIGRSTLYRHIPEARKAAQTFDTVADRIASKAAALGMTDELCEQLLSDIS